MKKVVVLSIVAITVILMQTGLVFSEEKNTAGEVFDLGEVLVTEKGGDVNLATTVNTVSIEDIERQGAQTAAEALEMIPGIDIQTGHKGQASLKLRGFSQEDVKVLIDGVPAHESYFGSLDLDQIPVDAISRIEVIKGASSVLYGANTMGGVINIITKKGGEKPETSITASVGKNSTQNYIANHGATFGKFNYWLTGSFRSTDGFELSDDFDPNNDRTGLGTDYNEDGGIRDLSDFTKRTLNAKIGFEHDQDSKIYLSFDYHDNEKGCPTAYDRYWKYDEWKQWHLNLVGQHDFTDMLTMKARLFYVDHDDTLEDVSWDADHTTGRKWFERSSYDDFSAGGELHSYLDFGKWSLLKIGMNYLKDNHKQQDFLDDECFSVIMGWDTPGFQPEEEYEAITYTFAMEDEIKPIDKLALIFGFSYDVYDPQKAYNQPVPDNIDSFNPQAGIVYDATDTFTLHASVGKKTRFPQLIELYSEQAGGNPNLDPQKAIAYEIGASKKFRNVLNTSMAIFYNDIKDKIERRDNLVSGEREYVNTGESDIRGMEINLDLIAFDQFQAGLNYTYLDAEEKEDNSSEERDSEYTPKHKINLDLAYMFSFGLSTFLQASYTADQIEHDGDNDVDIDNFFLLNAKLSQDLKALIKFESDVFIEIKNIADKDYEEGSGPMPGRSILVGMTVTF